MLDNEIASESNEPTESKPVTRRRRTASRPAGSPAPESTTPTEEGATTDITPKRRRADTATTEATTRRRKVPVEAAEAEGTNETVVPNDGSAEPADGQQAPEKPVRRRATRKTAAPAVAEADEGEVDAGGAAAAKAPAKNRRSPAKQKPAAVEEPGASEPETPTVEESSDEVAPADADEVTSSPAPDAPSAAPEVPVRRRRATRPTAAPEPVEPRAIAATPVQSAIVAAPTQSSIESAPQFAAIEAPVVEVKAEPVAQPPARRRRATRAAAAPEHVDAPVAAQPLDEATPEEEPLEEDTTTADTATENQQVSDAQAVEQPRSRRRRATRKAAAPEPHTPDETDDPIGAALKAAEDIAEARKAVQADPFITKEARDAELAALAGAIAAGEDSDEGHDTPETDPEPIGDEAAAQHGDGEADTDEPSGEEPDAESDDERPARRRRRRGGRRRRRSDSRDEDSDDEADEDSGEEPPAEGAGENTSEGDSGSADSNEDDSDADENGSTTRRRRRRRRRGENDKEGSSDGEVTGIEGSTRMEAKRQRRKESRAAGRRRAPILSEAEFLARREAVDRKLIIRQSEDYTQLVVIEDDILVEHYVDKPSAASLIGNIYLGKVQNVLPSMEAAFIDIGRGRNAVLYAGEVDWASFGATGENRKVENVLKSGQSVLVQVTKDPVGAKGARLTAHISLPGRYIVYSPGGHLSGISRKLPDIERNRLRSVLSGLISDDESVIVRTAAEGVAEDELVRDVNRLKAQWEVIEKKSKQGGAPQALYAEPDLTLRIVRDLFTEDFGHLIVQGNGEQDDAFDAISAYVGHVAPHLADRVERFEVGENGKDVFAKFRVDEQIAKALDRKVYLPSGGSLVIDRTEAMTVIDVNTGRFTGSAGNLEATVTSNNLEAAEEIVRQLRLRDLGGIIVIDFIDMVLPSNRDLLLRRLVECLARDRTRHQVAEVTSLGLVQLTRKRIGTGLAEAFTEPCEHCHGAGYLRFDDPVDSQAPADGGERKSGNRRRRK